MTLRRALRIGVCRKGATVVEFALLAPLFVAMLFALIEGGRMLWTRQTLENVAHAGARCLAAGANACLTLPDTRNHVAALATERGVRLLSADVAPERGVDCQGLGGFDRVSVSVAFNSPASGLLPLPDRLSASACFSAAPV